MPSQNFPISMCDDCTSSLLCTPPERSISLCSITAHQEMEGSNSPSSSILQAGQIQIPQHLLVCHVLQPPTTWAALLWVLSSFSLPFLHWGPKTGQSIIPRTASSRAIVTPPQLAGHALANTAQNAISLHCRKNTPLTLIQHCFSMTIYFYSYNTPIRRIRG